MTDMTADAILIVQFFVFLIVGVLTHLNKKTTKIKSSPTFHELQQSGNWAAEPQSAHVLSSF